MRENSEAKVRRTKQANNISECRRFGAEGEAICLFRYVIVQKRSCPAQEPRQLASMFPADCHGNEEVSQNCDGPLDEVTGHRAQSNSQFGAVAAIRVAHGSHSKEFSEVLVFGVLKRVSMSALVPMSAGTI